MVFSSLTFLCAALPIALAVYFALPRKLKNTWLLVFSLLFYAWGERVYIFLMLFSITVNWLFARLIDTYPAHKRALIFATCALDIGLLIVFKYASLIVSTVNACLPFSLPVPLIPLPIGISFFTFQAMSYVIDVYRGRVCAERRLDKVALYISLFPQLIAGPIVRYVDIAAQIDDRRETMDAFTRGMARFIVGLSKKVLIANALAPLADEAFALAGGPLGAAGAWLGLISYALQILFDFSGYSDMAIGLGHMFGFTFLENFSYPYIARSIKEFWNRWHISLSTWFRDYVYIPLGGNRRGRARQLFNISVVFLLTGIWHGASWTFLLWGAYHGFFRILEELIKKRPPKAVEWALTLLIVLGGWLIFRADNLHQALQYLRALAGRGGAQMLTTATPRALLAMGAGMLACYPWRVKVAGAWVELARWAALAALLMLCMLSLAAGTYNPFIYFRF